MALSPELRTVLVVILYILAIIIFISLFGFFSAIKPPKFNSKITPADFGLEYENVEFKSDITLRGWFIPSKHSNATIIIGHGYPFDKGNVLPAIKFLNKKYNLLLYDFRSFGESEGSISTVGYKETDDAVAAVKYLKKRKDVGKIGAWGISLSSSTFIMAAARTKDIKVIVADCPYASLEGMIDRTYRFLFFLKYPFVFTTNLLSKMVLGVDPAKVSPVDDIKKLDIPVFLIHGKRDFQIPFESSQMLYDAANEPKKLWLIEKAGHCRAYSTNPAKYEKEVMGFFDKYLNVNTKKSLDK